MAKLVERVSEFFENFIFDTAKTMDAFFLKIGGQSGAEVSTNL